MAKLILVLLMLSLTGNRLPWLNITALLLLVLLYLSCAFRGSHNADLAPRAPARWVKRAFAFWLTSYLLTQAPISNLFSFDFLRRDGALLFAYLPLLIMEDYGLNQEFLNRLIRAYLSIMSAVAAFGALLYLEALGNLSISANLLPEDLQVIVYSPLSGFEFHGFFEAHNSTGAVYGLACCISLSLLIFAERYKLWSLPTFWFSATFLGLMLSKSRTAYVAFAVTALALLFLKAKDRRKVAKLTIFLIAPLGYFVLAQPEVSQRAEAVTSADDPNILERLIYFQRAKDDFLASPLIGIGFGRYNDEFLSFAGIPNFVYVATQGEIVNESTHAHNSYLHFLAEGGLIGLGLMMAIWVSAYRWARKMQRRLQENTSAYALSIGVQACILFEFCISFTEHSMGTAVTSLTIFTILGVLRNIVCSQAAGGCADVPITAVPRPSTA